MATDEQILRAINQGLSGRKICKKLHVGDKRVRRARGELRASHDELRRMAIPKQFLPARAAAAAVAELRLDKWEKENGCHTVTMPEPSPEAGGPTMPDSLAEHIPPLELNNSGFWLILSDVHLPHHDKVTCERAIEEAKRRNANVFLNGDMLDCGELSTHKKHKSVPRYRDELAMGKQFFRYLRSRLPDARILYKPGNHEDRLGPYIMANAAALEDVPGMGLPHFLGLKDFGIEWVESLRLVKIGKLHVIHGHEYRGSGGVNPARWLRLKAHDVALCGHFHKTSEDGDNTIAGYQEHCWSTGCACYIHPEWLPFNGWNHGFAMVDLAGDGHFKVRNMRVLNGEIV